ncbi:MAG: saccharopine dehydrogenase NADP-binding domain-containing protein [Myxococcota bacterium]|nr:saccharopine dehydrogenase NADP-binding domain-containing protein [Myxococcota bacterium]MDW8362418.1 saccharopine dehydrogenase C-terminal domain-containing protein [Myxococcales bacterium]
MRFLVLGAGRMGRAIAFDLVRTLGRDAVAVADGSSDALDRIARWLEVRTHRLDLADTDALRPLLERAEVAVSAADYALNLTLTRLCIETRTHMLDLGGNNDVVAAQLALDAQAARAGVLVVPDCGLAPGLAVWLAARAVERTRAPRAVRIRVGGLPARPEPPLGYALFFSVRGLINEYVEPPVALRSGRLVRLEPLGDVEPVELEAPFGTLEAFNTSGGCSTLPQTLAGRVEELDYKTIRWPGHAAAMRAMLGIGLMSSEPLDVHGTRIAPRAVLEALLERNLPRTDDDVVIVRVRCEGRDGQRVGYDLVDRYDPPTGQTAMARTTGYPTSIAARLIADGHVEARGVVPGERCLPVDRIVEQLAERGVLVRTSDSG